MTDTSTTTTGSRQDPAGPQGPTRRPRRDGTLLRLGAGAFVLAVVFEVAVLSLGGGGPQPVPPGLPDPGAFVGWAVPTTRLGLDLGLVIVVGSLMAATFLLPGRAGQAEGLAVDAVRWAARGAALWAVAALALFVFTAADTFATPVGGLNPTLLSQFFTETSTGRALIIHAVVGATAVVALRWTVSVRVLVTWLAVVLATIVPLTIAGHSASSGAHDLAGISLALHVASASLWIGGIIALGWISRRGSKRFDGALRRYSAFAAWAFALVAVSGVLNASLRLRSWDDLTATSYGRVVLVKTVLLLVLGTLGAVQRRRLAERSASFGAVATLEAVLMVVVVGISVALARTPTPVGVVFNTPVEELLNGPLPPAPTLARYALGTTWSGIGLLVVVLGTAFYLRGWWNLRRRGVRWPVGRLISWLVGVLVVAYATMGGLGVYSHVLFSAHMVSHMLLSMVAPIFLVLAAPLTLALRTLPGPRGPGEVSPRLMLTELLHSRFAKVVTFPVVPPLLFVGSLYGLYFTPIFDVAMDSHWGHSLMVLHFLAVGSLFYYVVIGVDPQPRALPPLARFGVMLLTLPFHAFFAIAVMSANEVFGREYFTMLDRPYSTDLLRDQYLGGSVTWALGEVPMVLVMVALLAQWFLSDQREARRLDRQADRDDDAALEAYNARLRAMNEQESARR